EISVALPAGARVSYPRWNANGSMFAFINTTATSVELWVGDAATAGVHRIDGINVNPVLGYSIAWMPDQKTLLAKSISPKRAAPPQDSSAPVGPHIEESGAGTTASSTYEARDLLRTPHDADLFEYYANSRLALVDASTGRVTTIGDADVLGKVLSAPDGRHL